ncbi:MAG: Amidohydrolase [Thermotoga sp. 50_1627]|uniref:M20 family metallopeptidase n=1 Tax=Pseudothermotoga sp. TaxID=2033661 RepID=UPI00076DC86B|nr:MAG: Amidohydrolase [Thermotoga sp. 50_64]KUK25720.1 MAG: Amidohydrolase [Thermotoga sp. 50_1627]MBC7115633.1 amidohydrolase [Pseudothermotoga sp.]HBT39949.1 amidohydrolase [Pseudothermotoga sp.]HCO98508.1 amidohydrolase [Pseudothermotoga sp.]
MDEVVLRRLIHQNPELAFEEHNTQKLIIGFAHSLGLNNIVTVGTGVLVLVGRNRDEPFVLLRAEMDALPIREETKYAYRSKNEKMHACGHDFHIAAACWAMRRIVQEKRRGNFLFVFQPAEESGAGAKTIVEHILRWDCEVKAAVAMHVTDEYPIGVVASKPGSLFSASCEVNVHVKGRSVHVAHHQLGKDALRGSVVFLNRIYEKDWQNDLVWFGRILAGHVRNTVADEALIEGTVRASDSKNVHDTLATLQKIAKEVEEEIGLKVSIIPGAEYPEVKVDEKLLSVLKAVSQKNGFEFMECERKLTAEDFGYFSKYFPTLMFWFGVREGSRVEGLHSSRFLPPDELIPVAGDLLAHLLDSIGQS